MKKIISIITILVILAGVIACPILYFNYDTSITDKQKEILNVLLIILASSVLYCFVVGEITKNNSQMDKLWSILPAVYAWVIAIMGGINARTLVMAILATIWGARLTYNFAKKGAYKIKFWQGEEDYRWKILRENKYFKKRMVWALFDLLFISLYQNVLIFLTVAPALVCVGSETSFNAMDFVASALMLFFIFYEGIADLQQWNFQSKKWQMINEGKKLEELEYPYSLGFNTTGLWNVSRHPNYFAEQMIWVSFYLFSIAAGKFVFNYTMLGALLLILLFFGSTAFAEQISSSKYPSYSNYIDTVSKFIPFKRYRKEKVEVIK